MVVKDLRNKIIEEGVFVKYMGTNTTGFVTTICIKDDKNWIKIDKTGLFYLSEYLIVIEPNNKDLKIHNKEKSINNLLKPSKNFKKAKLTEISDHTDGPGYGGG